MHCVQVKFHQGDGEFGGILIDNRYLICGCCGGVFDLEEDDIIIEKVYEWIDISDTILD